MISFKEPKISSYNTSKIIEFRQITQVLDIFLLPNTKAAHHLFWHFGETHWWFQKSMTNLVLWKFSQSLENNGTKILKIRASLFLSCTPYVMQLATFDYTWQRLICDRKPGFSSPVPKKPYWLKANFKNKRNRDFRFVANWPPRKSNFTSPGGKLETMQILSYREKIPFVSFWAGPYWAALSLSFRLISIYQD